MHSTFRLVFCSLLILVIASTADAETTITSVSASGNESGNPPEHVLDNNAKTRWAQQGKGQWIQIQLSQPTSIGSVEISFYRGTRKYEIELQFSQDGKQWSESAPFRSNGEGDQLETFKFESTTATYIRLISRGSNANDWINITAFQIPGVTVSKALRSKISTPEKPKASTSRASGGIEVSEFATTGTVGSPVGISVDNQGRVYVTETRRRKRAAPDVRSLTPFMLDALASQSVGDKSAAIRRHRRDWEELQKYKEVIWRLTDIDGDGNFDQRIPFFEGLNEDVSGVAGGVLCVERDVYVTCIPSFYRLRDSDNDGKADRVEELARGMGIHIGYAGHDMHGPTLGVDGRIYWSMGDKGIRVIRKEDGRDFFFPGHGAVFRIEQDGTGFEVFASGLRNPQELAFDAFGNLFTADNDGDMGDRERLHFLVEGVDVGWRAFYQYRGRNYNPWMKDRLWETKNEKHPAYLSPPLDYTASGPIGFVFNPGTALNEKYRDYFFLANSSKSTAAFQMKPAGAGFQRVDKHTILSNTFATGLSFGPDGALYAADWGNNGWQPHDKGRVLKLDTPETAKAPLRQQTQQLLNTALGKHSVSELSRLLAHPDQRVRLKSQFELVRRNEIVELVRICSAESNSMPSELLPRLHAIWGIGQIGRRDSSAVEPLIDLLEDNQVEVRAQAAKIIGDAKYANGADPIAKLLADEEPRVRMIAGVALRHIAQAVHQPSIVNMLEENDDKDDFLRHAGVMALTGLAVSAPNKVIELTGHKSAAVRAAAVVALRRAGNPEVWRFLNDAAPQVAAESARAIHDDLSIDVSMEQLAKRLAIHVGENEALGRRAISANRRLANAMAAKRLAQFASQPDESESLRTEALTTLAEWGTPLGLDRVQGHPRNLPPADVKFAHAALDLTLGSLLASKSNAIQQATTKAIANLKYGNATDRVSQLALDATQPANVRNSSLEAMFALDAPKLNEALDLASNSADIAVRSTALRIRGKHLRSATSTFDLAKSALASEHLHEQQVAVDVLGKLKTAASNKFLTAKLRAFKDVPPALQLDLYLATKDSTDESVNSAVTDLNAEIAKRPLDKFSLARVGGNVEAGRNIFVSSAAAQCSRCHKLGGKQNSVGPDLLKIATKRDLDYLLRAIVKPSADMDAKYRPQQFILLSGKTVSGTVLSETDDAFIVAESADKTTRVAKEDVDERVEQKVSIMPDMTKTLSLRQIRDLVAFLSSLK